MAENRPENTIYTVEGALQALENRIRSWARRWGNLADDCAQAARTAVVIAWFQGSPRRDPIPYLTEVARNAIIAEAKSLNAHPYPPPSDADPNPEALAVDRLFVRSLLSRLPATERSVIELYHFQYLTFAEIADQLTVAETSVRRTYRRALDRLHELATSDPPDAHG